MGIANKALNLAYYELLGDASDCNKQAEYYNQVTIEQIMQVAKNILIKENCSILKYHAKK